MLLPRARGTCCEFRDRGCRIRPTLLLYQPCVQCIWSTLRLSTCAAALGSRIRYLMRVQVALRSANAENSTLMTGLCTLTTAGPYVTEIFKIFNPHLSRLQSSWRLRLLDYCD